MLFLRFLFPLELSDFLDLWLKLSIADCLDLPDLWLNKIYLSSISVSVSVSNPIYLSLVAHTFNVLIVFVSYPSFSSSEFILEFIYEFFKDYCLDSPMMAISNSFFSFFYELYFTSRNPSKKSKTMAANMRTSSIP